MGGDPRVFANNRRCVWWWVACVPSFPASPPSSMPSASASSPSTFSGGDRERTAQDVHATLCALVMAEAAKHEAWSDYAAVLLDEETAAFFAARLPEAKARAAGGESESPPSKKRKKQVDSDELKLQATTQLKTSRSV